MPTFRVYWRDEIQYSVLIDADTKDEALEKLKNSDYNQRTRQEENVQDLSSDDEIIDDMEIVE